MDKKVVEGDFVKNIASVEERVKMHKELEVKYMSMLAEYHDMMRLGRMEGRKEGIKEGRMEGIINNVRSLMQNTGWELDKALSVLSVSKEDAAIVAKSI